MSRSWETWLRRASFLGIGADVNIETLEHCKRGLKRSDLEASVEINILCTIQR